MTYAPLHGHTWYSLLDGIADPVKIAARAADQGFPAIAMSDHGNIGGCVDFVKATRKVGVRPILGCEFYLSREDPAREREDPGLRRANGRPYAHLVVLARNLAGWKQVIRAVSQSNHKDYFYYNPRLCLENFREYAAGGDLIAISGHPGSDLGNCIFKDPRAAYACLSYDTLLAHHIHGDSKARLVALAERYVSVFGRGNFFLEIQVLDPDGMPACRAIATALRWLARRLGLRCVATADAHYVEREDSVDQRVLLCAKFQTTHAEVRRKVEAGEEIELGGFFRGDHFHIPTYAEMGVHHTAEELANTLEVAAMCDDYDILSQPRMPAFPCPGGLPEAAYLRQLAEAGFGRLVEGRADRLDRPVAEYRDRLDMELGVFEGAGLSPYFLIVQDITGYARSRGWLIGPGRGSAAGCLLSYLIGITSIDPLPYDLLFERFYNAGRNKPGHISLPDVDVDLPVIKRDEVFRMMQGKYGRDHVAKIATFSTLQGRSALDAVLAANAVPFDLRKQITAIIPDKQRISEELQDMKDRGEPPSILRYALDVYADELAEWARLEADGTISGEYAFFFEQATRLEGTKKNLSTHAAGVVISSEPLANVCPLRWDDGSDAYVAAMEKDALEAMGLVKLDLLGVAMLNKGEAVRDLALTGEIADVA